MIFMVWLMLAVFSVVAVFLGMILDIEGLRAGWKIGRRCTGAARRFRYSSLWGSCAAPVFTGASGCRWVRRLQYPR